MAQTPRERYDELQGAIDRARAKIEYERNHDDGTDRTVGHRIDVCNERIEEWTREQRGLGIEEKPLG